MKDQFKISFDRNEEGLTFNIYIGKNIGLSNFKWRSIVKVFAIGTLFLLTALGKVDWKVIIELVLEILNKT